ncbi:MAG: DUF6090 family protein [Aureibaculum sp.]|nr:DUF6090 family protein [Aureibaculum sp.]
MLVVIGILIAVSINNWKQSMDLNKVEQNLYNDLIQELQIDLVGIQRMREYNNYYLARYNRASEIIINDTQKQFIVAYRLATTVILTVSGKLKVICQF